jgi:hypothetical protein
MITSLATAADRSSYLKNIKIKVVLDLTFDTPGEADLAALSSSWVKYIQ